MKQDEFNLIKALKDREDTSVIIWLFNIGVERFWNESAYTVKDKAEDILVNHMEEMNLLITRKQDYMILRKRPSEEFLNEFERLGFELPNFLILSKQDEEKSISELVLSDEILMNRLKMIASTQDNVMFVPYGVSYLEEEIAKKCGLSMFGAESEMNKRINDKIYSRKVAIELGLPVAEGNVCETLQQVQETCIELWKKFEKVIIKMPYGASGKGLFVVDSEKKLKSILMVLKRLQKGESDSVWLVEGWYEKKADLNIQIHVSATGEVNTFSIKEQMLQQTVYIGTVLPPRIEENEYQELFQAGNRIGTYFSEQHFQGILGVDAMITSENVIIPIIEINARFTLSTYLSFLQLKFPDKKLLASYIKIHLKPQAEYGVFLKALKQAGIAYDTSSKEGCIVYTSETINGGDMGKNGRFFMIAVADSYEKAVKFKQMAEEIVTKVLDGMSECPCESERK